MASQAYKVVTNHAQLTLGWTILFTTLRYRYPHLGETNGDVHSEFFTLALNEGERLEYFYDSTLRI